MYKRQCELTSEQVVFKSITLTGFWLAKIMRGMAYDDIAAMYGALAARIVDGTIAVPVEARYPLADIQDALRHAGTYGRGGKILLRPDAG